MNQNAGAGAKCEYQHLIITSQENFPGCDPKFFLNSLKKKKVEFA